MPEYQQELMEIINISIDEFNNKEKYLIKNDLSERWRGRFLCPIGFSLKLKNNYTFP